MRTIFYIAPTCLSRHLWGAYTKPQFLENVQHMYVCMYVCLLRPISLLGCFMEILISADDGEVMAPKHVGSM